MRGTSTSTLIIVAAVIAVVAIAGLTVLRMGEAAVGGVSASVSLAEEGGVVTATIHVLKGSLKGVAIKYIMPDGKSWWAKPIFCMVVNNTASVTPTAVYFSKPVPAGQAVTCAFYIWAPSNGMYSLWVLGYRPSGAGSVTFAQSRLHLSANKYQGNLPVGTMTSGGNMSMPIGHSKHNYTLIPVNWHGGVLAVQAQWGYTQTGRGVADGLYISLFVPYNYTDVVAPSDAGLRILPFGGADYTPAGSSLQLFVQFNPWDYGYHTGSIEFAVMNASGGIGTVQPRGFNPDKNWPANTTWTTYVVYNATSNTLYVRWVVPGVFDDVEYTYDLNTFGDDAYRFTPPPPGQYYVVVGVATGGDYVDWKIYSYTVATS